LLVATPILADLDADGKAKKTSNAD